MAGITEGDGGQRGNHWRVVFWTAAAVLLLLPLLAMQVTDGVNWNALDFAILGALLLGAGVTYELAARKTSSAGYRSAVAVALVTAFLLIGVNGAVGIIGNETNDANLMFAGVLAVGVIGSFVARFRSRGMSLAMAAAAAAQVLVAVIALVAGSGSTGPGWPQDVLVATVFFTALWLGSAWLFRRAGRE